MFFVLTLRACHTHLLFQVKADPGVLDDFNKASLHNALSSDSLLRGLLKDFPQLFRRDKLAMDNGKHNYGPEFEWFHGQSQSLFQFFFEKGPAFQIAVKAALVEHPCSPLQPWHLVLYLDEVTPGNPLRPDNARKIWAVYMAFREFGKRRLCQTKYWIPTGVLRTKVAKHVRGGVSNLARTVLRSMFLTTPGWSSEGVAIRLSAEVCVLIFAKLSNILGDEAGMNATCSSKGASGIVPCLLCKNVICKNNDEGRNYLSFATGDYLVDISESNSARFDLCSDADIWEKHDILKASKHTLGQAEFENLERAQGLNYNEHGILADAALRPFVPLASVWTYDPMHNNFANGIAHVEFTHFLEHLRKEGGVHFDAIGDLMSSWSWPKFRYASKAKVMGTWTPTRERSAESGFKGQASEMLIAYPILRWLCTEKLLRNGVAVPQAESFIAMCQVLDQVVPGATDHTPDILQQALREHMDKFKVAYGAEHMKPKHHFNMHQPQQFRRDGMLLDTWTPERFHQITKAASEFTGKTTTYEKSCFTKLVHLHLEELQEVPKNSLVGKLSTFPELAPDARVARALETVDNRRFAAEDIVIIDGRWLALVLCGLHYDSKYSLLCELLENVRQTDRHTWTCEHKGDDWQAVVVEIALHDIAFPVCWSHEDARHIIVLV